MVYGQYHWPIYIVVDWFTKIETFKRCRETLIISLLVANFFVVVFAILIFNQMLMNSQLMVKVSNIHDYLMVAYLSVYFIYN